MGSSGLTQGGTIVITYRTFNQILRRLEKLIPLAQSSSMLMYDSAHNGACRNLHSVLQLPSGLQIPNMHAS